MQFVQTFTQHNIHVKAKPKTESAGERRRKLCDGRGVKTKNEDVVKVGVEGTT